MIAFGCVFGSALLGLHIRTLLPGQHLSDDSIEVVKLATGLIATIAALVLGLLISSAKTSFDTVSAEVTHAAANIIILDRVLARYGPETQEIRGSLKQVLTTGVQKITSGDPAQLKDMYSAEAHQRGEYIERRLSELSPQNDSQRRLQARAIEMADTVLAVRELGLLQAVSATPPLLLAALVLWLCIIFGTFGLFTQLNGTVVTALCLGALSTSVAIFLILEMNSPLEGMITVSFAPMRAAIAILGQ
ncbi:bestrophin-like domain [Paraburkholderia sp. 2C]